MNDQPLEPTADRPVSRDLYLLARHWLGQRRTWLILAAVALALGAYFNWQWLTAAGIAPLLVAVAPCLALCALGLCMHRGKGCDTQPGAQDKTSDAPRLPTDERQRLHREEE